MTTSFRYHTRELLIEIALKTTINVFGTGNAFTRLSQLAKTKPGWDGEEGRQLSPESLLTYCLFFMTVKLTDREAITEDTFFHDTEGNLELVFTHNGHQHQFTFLNDVVAYSYDDDEDSTMSLSRAVKLLKNEPYFEERSVDEQKKMKTNDLLFCVEESRWISFRNNPDAHNDPLIIPILDKLNRKQFIITRWSCQGHPERDDHLGYIVIMARSNSRENTVAIMEGLHDWLHTNVMEKWIGEGGEMIPATMMSLERVYLLTADPCYSDKVVSCLNYILSFSGAKDEIRDLTLKEISAYLDTI